MFHHIIQSYVKLCNRFEFPHTSSPPATTASHFLHYSLVDQLCAKKVYFCSFVTKCNQESTKYSADLFNSFYRTLTHRGPSHRIFTKLPIMQHFPTYHYRNSSICCLYIFFHYSHPSPIQRIHKISKKFLTSLLTCYFSTSNKISFLQIAPSPLLETPPKVYAVSIDPDIPALRELGVQRIIYKEFPHTPIRHFQSTLSIFNHSQKIRKDSIHPWGHTRKSWTHLASLLPWLTSGVRCKFIFSPSRKGSLTTGFEFWFANHLTTDITFNVINLKHCISNSKFLEWNPVDFSLPWSSAT